MRQKEAAQKQVRNFNRERDLKDVMAEKFQCWIIDARLSDIAIGRIEPNGSLWLQYGVKQLRWPTGAQPGRQPVELRTVGLNRALVPATRASLARILRQDDADGGSPPLGPQRCKT